MWSEYLADFYEPIQIFGRNGPVGYCLFSPLNVRCTYLFLTGMYIVLKHRSLENKDEVVTELALCAGREDKRQLSANNMSIKQG